MVRLCLTFQSLVSGGQWVVIVLFDSMDGFFCEITMIIAIIAIDDAPS